MIRSTCVHALASLILMAAPGMALAQPFFGRPGLSTAARPNTPPAANPRGAAAETPAVPQIYTPPEGEAFYEQLDKAIQVTSQRYLTANVHTPWQIFHGILALHQEFKLKLGDQKISAVEWIATTEPVFDGKPWILVTNHGAKFHPFTRPYAFEGHPAQFLALLSESDLPTTFTFKAAGQTVTIQDMINNTMKEVNSREEITWVLWSLNHYLESDAQWYNQQGEAWSIEKLVDLQNKAAVYKGACGGNHGLYVLARARDKYLAKGQPLRGVWFEADQKINQFAQVARTLQNVDGSFSANFYQGAKYSNDLNSRLNTTGHTLEFLANSLPEQQLNDPWVRHAVAVLSRDLVENRTTPADCGPLYHSLNALISYQKRTRSFRPATLTKVETPLALTAPPAAEKKPAEPAVKPEPAVAAAPAPVAVTPAPTAPVVTTPVVPAPVTPAPGDLGSASPTPTAPVKPVAPAPASTPVTTEPTSPALKSEPAAEAVPLEPQRPKAMVAVVHPRSVTPPSAVALPPVTTVSGVGRVRLGGRRTPPAQLPTPPVSHPIHGPASALKALNMPAPGGADGGRD